MRAEDRLSLACAAAALAGSLALTPLTTDRTYLFLAALLVGSSALVGAVGRRLSGNELVVRLLQALPLVGLLWLVPATRKPAELALDTADFVRESVAPMSFHAGFAVFCVLLTWLLYLIIETLAVALNTPAWTFPAIFTPYLITASVSYFETSPVLFALPALGYGLVLATSVANRWLEPVPGREPTGAELAGLRSSRRGILRSATATLAAALVLSLAAGAWLPERYRDWSIATGPGAVQLSDPTLDLVRNLNSTSNLPVISYTSSNPDGESLRLAALPVLDQSGFHLAATELLGLQIRSSPAPELVAANNRSSIQVKDFASEYLPVPWVPETVTVTGEWRYDPATLAVVAVGDGRRIATKNLSFEVTSSQLHGFDDLLPRLKEAGTVGDDGITLAVPDGLDPRLHDLAAEVTEDAGTAGEKAKLLRDYLRSERFRYSTKAVTGTTLGTLNDFLLASRTGYCEQFAGALAVLARIVEIPSRVVIGFLPGKKDGDTWEITPRNMHAWTELYFAGAGWVAVDATPPGAVGGQNEPSASPTASASPTPSAASPSATTAPAPRPGTAGQWADLPPIAAWLLAAVLLVAAAVLAPRLARRLLRTRRLGARDDPLETSWTELAALARDRGAPWPDGSTRVVASTLAPMLDADAAAALTELALAVERSRYAEGSPDAAAAPALAARVEAGMEKRWAAPTAWLDRWWPRSLWPRRG